MTYEYVEGRLPEVGDWIKQDHWSEFWEVHKLTPSGVGVLMDLRDERGVSGSAYWDMRHKYTWKYSEPEEPVCDIPDYLYDREEDV